MHTPWEIDPAEVVPVRELAIWSLSEATTSVSYVLVNIMIRDKGYTEFKWYVWEILV